MFFRSKRGQVVALLTKAAQLLRPNNTREVLLAKAQALLHEHNKIMTISMELIMEMQVNLIMLHRALPIFLTPMDQQQKILERITHRCIITQDAAVIRMCNSIKEESQLQIKNHKSQDLTLIHEFLVAFQNLRTRT